MVYLIRNETDFDSDLMLIDFTPEFDRQRLQEVALHKPDLLTDPKTGEQIFTRLQCAKKLSVDDLRTIICQTGV